MLLTIAQYQTIPTHGDSLLEQEPRAAISLILGVGIKVTSCATLICWSAERSDSALWIDQSLSTSSSMLCTCRGASCTAHAKMTSARPHPGLADTNPGLARGAALPHPGTIDKSLLINSAQRSWSSTLLLQFCDIEDISWVADCLPQ